ncbi:DUF6082 family protein [Paractinoplanes atraurantiacus]|uniref:Uncharacterized protein n=1 Tax=Paractinoplanes atraurantiacus TaxID=1036182 RepID=A0A285JAJ2_9ACTN|nr:DUF6082 family protein [Actinoplanes atraurantiacus]SNY56406.1 hypothetical protein SAMN05421748_117151 [Actinoplanes atraurantiacus]
MSESRVTVGRAQLSIALTVTAMACLVIAITVAPWLMSVMTSRPVDWRWLADVGQAYGGISAILSGLALCGIAGSLVLQWRQARLADAATRRAQQIELVKVSLSDPDLAFPVVPGIPWSQLRRWMILNLWVSHWAMLWNTGTLSRSGLRHLFEELFRDPAALTWWASIGARAWADGSTRRSQSFRDLADDTYREAVDAHAAGGGAPINPGTFRSHSRPPFGHRRLQEPRLPSSRSRRHRGRELTPLETAGRSALPDGEGTLRHSG